MISLNINNKNYQFEVEEDTPLLRVIREHIQLTVTKFSCRIGECGACMVHINKSQEPPGGVGEPGVPPIAPAVANGFYAASGIRMRNLPMIPAAIQKAAV